MDDTKPIHRKVSFGRVAVQQLRRIAIPPLLAENMQLVEGDELVVYFDPDSKAAVLVKAELIVQPEARQKKARSR